jgi:hypothetical protein
MTTTIREAAWRDLIERAWDRFPARYADAVLEPLATGPEVMEALASAASPLGPMLHEEPRFAPNDGSECQLRLYREGGELQDRAQFLAFRAAGSSIEEYGALVAQRLNGKRFAIVVNEFQKICPPLWQRLKHLLTALAAEIGFSAAKSEAVLFIGDYPATPFGVHKDSAVVLQFSILGTKTMLFWGPGELPPNYLSIPAAALARTALALECGPRDFLAWPPEYHHVARNDQVGLVATLSVPVYIEFEPIKLILQSLQAAFHGSIGSGRRSRRLYRGEVAHALEASGTLPEEFEIAWKHLEMLMQSGAAAAWLRSDLRCRYSAVGLEPPPQCAKRLREVQQLLEISVSVREGRSEFAGIFTARVPHDGVVHLAGYVASEPGARVSLVAPLDDTAVVLNGTVVRVDKNESVIALDLDRANGEALRRLACAKGVMTHPAPHSREPLEVSWTSHRCTRRAPVRDVGPSGMFIIDGDPPPLGAMVELRLHIGSSVRAIVTRVIYRDDTGFAVFQASPGTVVEPSQ